MAPKVDSALQGKPHEDRAERQNHLPWPAGHTALVTAQDMIGLQASIAGSCWAFNQQPPPNLPPQISQGVHFPAYAYIFDCSEPGAAPCTGTCWTSLCSHGPASEAYPGPSLWLVSLWFGAARKMCHLSSSLWKTGNTWWFRAAKEAVVCVRHWCCNQFLRTQNNSKYGKVTLAHNSVDLTGTLMITG